MALAKKSTPPSGLSKRKKARVKWVKVENLCYNITLGFLFFPATQAQSCVQVFWTNWDNTHKGMGKDLLWIFFIQIESQDDHLKV